jgi:hypothetical protein
MREDGVGEPPKGTATLLGGQADIVETLQPAVLILQLHFAIAAGQRCF